MSENRKDTLVEVSHLKQYFQINTGMFSSKPLKAVDDVSFSIRRGATLGLAHPAAARPRSAVRSCISTSLLRVRFALRASRFVPRRISMNFARRPRWSSRTLILR